jgi:Undecaprenyl-phosphate glucose phosphotransferase
MKPDDQHLTNTTGSAAFTAVLQQVDAKRWQRSRENILHDLPDRPFVAPRVVAAMIRLAEGLIVVLVAIGNLIRYPGFAGVDDPWLYGAVIAFAALGFPALLQVTGCYKLNTLLAPLTRIPTLAAMWCVLFGAVTLFAFAAKVGDDLSRGWLLGWAVSGFFLAIATRLLLSHFVRRLNRYGQLNRRAVLVGGGSSADHVVATLTASRDTGLSVLGVFDDRSDDRAPVTVQGLHKLGTVEDLIDFVRSTRVDTLILTLPVTAENRLLQILERLWVLPVDIRLSAQDQRMRFRPRAYSYIGNLALLDLFDRPLGDWGPFTKAVEDKLIAFLALILLSPVFLAVALAVKFESKGPAFFRQKRYGFNNEMIEVYKFRSMYTDLADVDARKLVSKDDPRVTRVGRIIRKTSLDELPQLINVLKGELSLVGPRPHATMASAAGNLYETVVEGYFARHKVKPGMTGWAQINGWRGETDTAEKIERRVEHDLYYIENWSLTFDLYILAKTPFALLDTKQAY